MLVSFLTISHISSTKTYRNHIQLKKTMKILIHKSDMKIYQSLKVLFTIVLFLNKLMIGLYEKLLHY